MRINIRFIYLLPIIIIYFTDKMFLETILGSGTPLALDYSRVAWIISFFGGLMFINYMSPIMKVWCMSILLGFCYLMLESLYLYGNPFQYPRVFSKILMVFGIFFVYGFSKKFNGKLKIEYVVNFISLFFFLNVLLINRDAFSLSSFANHERGLLAESVYFLIIPCLYYFNGYFLNKSIKSLYLFFLFFACIIFLQHRTVWVCTAFALLVNLLLLKKTKAQLNVESMIPVAIFLLLVMFFAGFFVFSNDVIMNKLAESVDDLMNPTSQGTGNWRWVQFTSYWPFVVDNILFGMRLEGFELPVQFFDRDTLAFNDGTGHHFHSLYIDRLFYFGFIGLFLLIIPPLVYIINLLSSIKRISIDQIVLVCYIATALVYGISYKLQPNVYATLGLAIYFLEYLKEEQDKENKQNKNEIYENHESTVLTNIEKPEPVLNIQSRN